MIEQSVKNEVQNQFGKNDERIQAIASRPTLSDQRSDIRNTDYWACKPK